MAERAYDRELEEATNRWMWWGLAIMAIMVAIFP